MTQRRRRATPLSSTVEEQHRVSVDRAGAAEGRPRTHAGRACDSLARGTRAAQAGGVYQVTLLELVWIIAGLAMVATPRLSSAAWKILTVAAVKHLLSRESWRDLSEDPRSGVAISTNDFADLTGLGRSTVLRSIQEALHSGLLLVWRPRREGGGNLTYRYAIDWRRVRRLKAFQK